MFDLYSVLIVNEVWKSDLTLLAAREIDSLASISILKKSLSVSKLFSMSCNIFLFLSKLALLLIQVLMSCYFANVMDGWYQIIELKADFMTWLPVSSLHRYSTLFDCSAEKSVLKLSQSKSNIILSQTKRVEPRFARLSNQK